MVTCRECGCEFQSIWREAYPGGAQTGATIVAIALLELVVAVVLLALAILCDMRGFYFLGAPVLVLALLKISSLPENRRVKIRHGGHKCPECGLENELHWYD